MEVTVTAEAIVGQHESPINGTRSKFSGEKSGADALTDLLPCPFCGADAATSARGKGASWHPIIACVNWCCSVSGTGGTREVMRASAAKLWNTRATLVASPVEQPAAVPAVELSNVKEALESGHGFWRTCSGCHESEDGHPVGEYPYSDILQCDLGAGCAECGGIGAVWDSTDYEDLATFLDRHEGADEAAQAVPSPADERAAEAVALPAGWRVVPKKITRAMIESAMESHYGKRRARENGGAGGIVMTVNDTDWTGVDAMRRFWKGALAAAPQPPAQADSRRQLGVLRARHDYARPFEFTPAAGAVIPYEGIPVFSSADTQAEAQEDAYVAKRMTETLASVYATIIGDDQVDENDGLNAIQRVEKAAQVLRLEVELYRAQADAWEAPRYREWRHLREHGEWSNGVPDWARAHDGRMNDLTAACAVIDELAALSSRSAGLTGEQRASCAVAADLAEANGLKGIADDLRALLQGAN
ncbi:hypothetical protein WM29_22755 [Burkholderia ubonensis]|nr:hypothetical protein WM29_22755 [Burkholderia ubonensis]